MLALETLAHTVLSLPQGYREDANNGAMTPSSCANTRTLQ